MFQGFQTDFRWVTERIQSPIQNLESIENEKENGKKISYILYEIFQGFQNCLSFYSSIKTEGVLFFFIYIYIYIYLYIYIYIYIKTKP